MNRLSDRVWRLVHAGESSQCHSGTSIARSALSALAVVSLICFTLADTGRTPLCSACLHRYRYWTLDLVPIGASVVGVGYLFIFCKLSNRFATTDDAVVDARAYFVWRVCLCVLSGTLPASIRRAGQSWSTTRLQIRHWHLPSVGGSRARRPFGAPMCRVDAPVRRQTESVPWRRSSVCWSDEMRAAVAWRLCAVSWRALPVLNLASVCCGVVPVEPAYHTLKLFLLVQFAHVALALRPPQKMLYLALISLFVGSVHAVARLTGDVSETPTQICVFWSKMQTKNRATDRRLRRSPLACRLRWISMIRRLIRSPASPESKPFDRVSRVTNRILSDSLRAVSAIVLATRRLHWIVALCCYLCYGS